MAAYKIMHSSKDLRSKRDETYPGIIILEYFWHPTIERVMKKKACLPKNNNMKDLIYLHIFVSTLATRAMTAVTSKVCGDIASSASQLKHDSMSQCAQRNRPVSPSFPGMLPACAALTLAGECKMRAPEGELREGGYCSPCSFPPARPSWSDSPDVTTKASH